MHRTTGELQAGLDLIRQSPRDAGTVAMIVGRPDLGERVVLETGELTYESGLVGDNWLARGSRHTDDGAAEPDRQLTIMNARAIELFAGDRSRWPLAGDQLFLDLDLSLINLPAGTRLTMGSAVVEVTVPPHNGCAKFAERFGMEAARFVNAPDGKALRLRGINARVVQPGTVRTGDAVLKVAAMETVAG